MVVESRDDPVRPSDPLSLVGAARTHLTRRFARGLDRLLWENREQPMSDTDAATETIRASEHEQLTVEDIAAALVVVQAAHLDLDRLEYRLWQLAGEMGLGFEQLAAVLGMTSAAAAEERVAWLRQRSDEQVGEADPARP